MTSPMFRNRRARTAEAVESVNDATIRESHLRSATLPVAAAEAQNPFRRANEHLHQANEDLADQWDRMQAELAECRRFAEQYHAEAVALRADRDSLQRELDDRTMVLNAQIDRQTDRADRAVAELAQTRAKFSLIAESLRMVLEDETKAQQPAAKPVATVVHQIEPNPGLTEADEAELSALVNRLPQNKYEDR